jgi:hypothetical protein
LLRAPLRGRAAIPAIPAAAMLAPRLIAFLHTHVVLHSLAVRARARALCADANGCVATPAVQGSFMSQADPQLNTISDH